MNTFPNLVAAAAALLLAALLAPAAMSLGVVALGLIGGTLWMGAVYLTLDGAERREDERRMPVPARARRRGADRRRR